MEKHLKSTLFANTREFSFNPNSMCQLIDSFVSSILNYGSKESGFYSLKDIERLHLKFYKWLLGVNLSTSNVGVNGELGRFLLGQIRLLKYRFKVIRTDNCITTSVYQCSLDDLKKEHINWAAQIC